MNEDWTCPRCGDQRPWSCVAGHLKYAHHPWVEEFMEEQTRFLDWELEYLIEPD